MWEDFNNQRTRQRQWLKKPSLWAKLNEWGDSKWSELLTLTISNIRSLPRLIVGISVWRVNLTAEIDQIHFASFSLSLKCKFEITQELWGALCSIMALWKGAEKLCHTMFTAEMKTVALSRHKFKKIKNLKRNSRIFPAQETQRFLSLLTSPFFLITSINSFST